MNRHVHADKIIAKAENMDLVVLHRFNDLDWFESGVDWCDSFSFLSEYEYFLCLPQHKEACLHWLNGGEIQYIGPIKSKWCAVETVADAYEYEAERLECPIDELGDFNPTSWETDSIFMQDDFELRIKPKMEKRWIAYVKDMKRLGVLTFSNEAEAIAHYGDEADSFHQIEVEV